MLPIYRRLFLNVAFANIQIHHRWYFSVISLKFIIIASCLFLACFLCSWQSPAYGQMPFDVYIQKTSTNIIVYNSNDSVIYWGNAGINDYQALQTAINYVSNGGQVKLGMGNYVIGSNILKIPEGVQLLGSGDDLRQSYISYSSRLYFTTGGGMILNQDDKIDSLQVDCGAKTDSQPCILLQGDYISVGKIWAWGSPYDTTIQIGNSTNLIYGLNVDSIYAQGGKTGFCFCHVTVSTFNHLIATDMNKTSMMIDSSDNNQIGYAQITSMHSKGVLLQYGNQSYAYGNVFDYLGLGNFLNGTSMLINYAVPYSQGANGNVILDLEHEGPYTVVHNNNSTQSVYAFDSMIMKAGYQ